MTPLGSEAFFMANWGVGHFNKLPKPKSDFGAKHRRGLACYLPAFWGLYATIYHPSPRQRDHPLSSLLLPGFGSQQSSSLSPCDAAKPPKLMKAGAGSYPEILIQKYQNVKRLSISSEVLWDFHFLCVKWHVTQSVVSLA